MALKKTASGKVDKRTKEYKVMKENMAKARRAKEKKEKSLVGRLKSLFK